MRRALVFAILLCGCWDFNSLQSGYGQQPDLRKPTPDAAGEPDLSGPSDDMTQTGIMNLLGYGELVLDQGNCPGTEMQSGPQVFDKPDLKNSCSGCACGQPDKCQSRIGFYGKNMCKVGDLTKDYQLATGTDCVKTPTVDKFYEVDSPQLSCKADGSKAGVDPGYGHQARLCTTGTGCTTLPCLLAQQPPGKKLCAALKQKGATCPQELPTKLAWVTYNDARTCTCACATPNNTTCDGNVTLFGDDVCTNMKGPDLSANGCQSTPGTPQSVQFKWTPKGGATCNPSGSTMGQGPAITDVTICCQA